MSQTKLAIIVSLCSILSPLIVTILNIWFKFKAKKLDYERNVTFKIYIHKREAFENYLKLIGETVKHTKPTNKVDLINSFYSVLPYISTSDRKFFVDITMNYLNEKTVSSDQLFKLIDIIAGEISHIPKK